MISGRRATAIAAVVAAGLSMAQAPNRTGDWPGVGFDPGGSKYSPLTQITPANVANLTTAWSYDLGARTDYTVTPIVINNVLYFPQGSNIVAFKADTGTELWKFDMKTL